jgi:hypothetical protein
VKENKKPNKSIIACVAEIKYQNPKNLPRKMEKLSTVAKGKFSNRRAKCRKKVRPRETN